ncbi:hypothetical protein I4U23_024514 [Adineta vaga]|nr:hypothetical protein I4U23_024514 [Adineta vaga]
MYTETNTNLEIIIENCQEKKVADKDNNCVLIITGSLNPIHRSHIKNLLLVKTYLEKHETRPLNVLAAYLSPTHDSYVRNKLGSTDWIPGEERCQLCEQAIDLEGLKSFISVAKGELEYDRFADFDEVTIKLAEYLNKELYKTRHVLSYPLKVVYVCGLDHFNKCSHVEVLARQKNIACAVIYRLGDPDHRIKRLEEKSSNIYYITLDDERETLIDISSTEIRKRYQNAINQNSNDDDDDDQITYPFVGKYLKTKYSKK